MRFVCGAEREKRHREWARADHELVKVLNTTIQVGEGVSSDTIKRVGYCFAEQKIGECGGEVGILGWQSASGPTCINKEVLKGLRLHQSKSELR